jgi:hypothetical protein
MWIAGSRDKDLRGTNVSAQITDSVRKLALVIAQFTVWETEFETTRPRHPQHIKSQMPFMVTDFGDIARCRSRRRRVPPASPVGGHSNGDRDPSVRLLGHEEATSDGLVVLMRRQHQGSSLEQGIVSSSPSDNLRPPPHSTNRGARESKVPLPTHGQSTYLAVCAASFRTAWYNAVTVLLSPLTLLCNPLTSLCKW